jgi:hypothetical protein
MMQNHLLHRLHRSLRLPLARSLIVRLLSEQHRRRFSAAHRPPAAVAPPVAKAAAAAPRSFTTLAPTHAHANNLSGGEKPEQKSE